MAITRSGLRVRRPPLRVSTGVRRRLFGGLTGRPNRMILLGRRGTFMNHRRVPLLPFMILALAASLCTFAQSIVSTHSGVVYFFEGSVFIEDQPLEQKFGKFPDIGEGHELRTEHGRAEMLLTPGVFLRMNESSAIRMLSIKLSDTRVELLDGSASVEANEAAPSASVTFIHKNWQVKIPQTGVYRIDSHPAQLRVYRGEAEVFTAGETETVT